MTINILEEAQRVEVACDGCGRVIHNFPLEEFKAEEYESPLKTIGGMSYCPVCQPNHEKRVEDEKNTYHAKHLQLRETITDSAELEEKLAALGKEYGMEETG